MKLDKIYRTTKCFGVAKGAKIKGAFPYGFLNWVQVMGWCGQTRCYLCSGLVDDMAAVRVDIRKECNPTHCEDAKSTSLKSESVDWVIIDPPYTKILAQDYYKTEKHYHGINTYTKEAERICKKGGLILTLSYEIPKRIKNCNFIAVVGVYTIPFTGYMRCFTVSKKKKQLIEKGEEG